MMGSEGISVADAIALGRGNNRPYHGWCRYVPVW